MPQIHGCTVDLITFDVMTTQTRKPQKGKLLVAEPFLGDPNFDRTVILLTEHNELGSVGFVLNKPLDIKVGQVALDFPNLQAPVYEGGPVQKDSLFFIHKKGDLIPGSEQIGENVYWGGELEPLKDLIDTGLVTESDLRFFLGYSGWSESQLQDEIAESSWIIADKTNIDVFNDAPDVMWRKVLTNLGGNYALWANSPFDQRMN